MRLPENHIASTSNNTRDLGKRREPVAPNASNRRVRIFRQSHLMLNSQSVVYYEQDTNL